VSAFHILGKTTLPEFGWKAHTDGPLFGITRSPWDLRMSQGGSSGGGAACEAAGIGPIAFGNDGGGSIRIPASYRGLYGLKPTFGRVPHHPQESPFAALVTGGPLARSVSDTACMLNELAKPDARDPYALPPDGRDYGSRSGPAAQPRPPRCVRRSRSAAGASPDAPDAPLDGRFDRVVSSRDRSNGQPGVAARFCPHCPAGAVSEYGSA
jgi:Asp-tRNA(Asn)/Glu-tRNA(Gln) amidotransferase A subunit family amidase